MLQLLVTRSFADAFIDLPDDILDQSVVGNTYTRISASSSSGLTLFRRSDDRSLQQLFMVTLYSGSRSVYRAQYNLRRGGARENCSLSLIRERNGRRGDTTSHLLNRGSLDYVRALSHRSTVTPSPLLRSAHEYLLPSRSVRVVRTSPFLTPACSFFFCSPVKRSVEVWKEKGEERKEKWKER